MLMIMFGFTGIRAQVIGDFQPKNVVGNWSDFNDWNIYNGASWVAAGIGQIPVTTTSVFIQAGQNITVDITTAACNDLNFTSNGITDKVTLSDNSILRIYGNIMEAGTNVIPFPGWGAGAKLIFSGSANQTITGSGGNTTLNNVEINKTGGTFILPAVITKYEIFTLVSGTLIAAPGSVLQGTSTAAIVNVNGGTWTSTAGGANRINGGTGGANCTLNISSGTMTLSTTSGIGFNFSDINISNAGVLNLNNDITAINCTNSFSVDATGTVNTAMPLATTPTALSMDFAGAINYTHTGSQTIINTTYGNLGLSGSLNKTPSADLTVTRNISIAGTAILQLFAFTAFIGGNWTNYGTAGLTEAGSNVDFNGNGAQTINTAGGEDFFLMKKSGSGTLTLNSNVATGGGAGSGLNISAGNLDAGTYTLSGTGSSTLTMTGGTLKLGKLISTLPEFIGIYAITGGTVELNGGLGAQVLRAGINSYKNLTFSGSGTTTLSSTSATGIKGTIYITGSAILDIGSSNTFGDINTNLTMDAGRLKMSGSISDKPDIDGTYNLTGGVIEFAGSNAGTQAIKGQSKGGTSNIIYKNIEVTGTNAGTGNFNIYLSKIAGNFTVKGPSGVYAPNIKSIVSENAVNTSTVTVENGATFKTGNNKGFSGFSWSVPASSSIDNNISSSGIFLNTGSIVDYAGTSAQEISNHIPYNNFTISSNGGIKTAPPGVLIIQGNISKTGTAIFSHNNGTVISNGTGAQVYKSVVPIMTFYNFTNSTNSGLTVNDSLAVVKQLLLSPGSVLSLGSGDIILKSSDTITANIAPISTAVINYTGIGRFIVERYINIGIGHAKSWQFLSVPTSGQTINAAWQEGGVAGNNPKPGYGTQLTNPLGTAAGYDVTSIGTSIKTYISISDKWDAGPSNTSKAINNSKGYMLFVRGNRTVASGSGTAPTILRTRGTLFTGPQPSIPVIANLYESIGNPYASAIDLRNVTRTNLTNEIYIWDPTLGGNYGVGGYRTLTWDGFNYLVVPQGGIYPGFVSDTLQSGQAFFVKSNGTASSSVQFTEAAKVSAGSRLVNSPGRGRPYKAVELLAVNLWLIQASGKKELMDGAIGIFAAKFSDKVDNEDGAKLLISGENIGFIREGKLLSVERRKSPRPNDTLSINLTGIRFQTYNFIFNIKNMNAPGRSAHLWDSYLDRKTALNLFGSTSIDFTLESKPASAAADRFKIVFSAKEPLPVTHISITAARNQDKSIEVNWTTENEINLENYTIERSSNCNSFFAVGMQQPYNNNRSSVGYLYKDLNPLGEENYYRIRALSRSSQVNYSATVKVAAVKLPQSISVYPNPIAENKMIVHFISQPLGNYRVELSNLSGQTVYHTLVTSSSNNFTKNFVLPSHISAGGYCLSITAEDGGRTVMQVMVK